MSQFRLKLPEPEIDLYKDGFDDTDPLNRKPAGDKLSDLVEKIQDPMVIALDGAWGSGKTVFLKRWVGHHRNRPGNTTQTVYFDAFQHDFLDDPLIALTGAIADSFETDDKSTPENSKKHTANIKKAAWAVGKGLARIGASAATFGATEMLGDMGDEIAKAVGKEAETFLNSETGTEAANDFWASQRARLAAMEAFRLSLVALTEPAEEGDDEGKPTRKLVIVIDELDRCRPDYALSLLEVIKHFFNVDGVHFVLGANFTELQNSVRARYGDKIDAALYLQKFIDLSLRLSNAVEPHSGISLYLCYYDQITIDMGISSDLYRKIGRDYLFQLQESPTLTLRGIQQFAKLIVIAPFLRSKKSDDYSHYLLVGLLFLKAFTPDIVEKIRHSRLEWDDIASVFHPIYPPDCPEEYEKISTAWYLCFSEKLAPELWAEYLGADTHSLLNSFDRSTPRTLLTRYADAFSLEGL